MASDGVEAYHRGIPPVPDGEVPLRSRDRSAFLALAAIVAHASPLSGQTLDPTVPQPTGPVHAITTWQETVYIGGSFDFLARGQETSGGGRVAANDATALDVFTAIGSPSAVVGDGNGGYFVGGAFLAFNGVSHARLVHVGPDFTVDAWNPSPDGVVRTLALTDGTLWVGGDFGTIAGQARSRLASFRTSNLSLTSWNPGVSGARVHVLAVRDSLVYVGGAFNAVGGAVRSGLACITRTGALTPWDPAPAGTIHDLLVDDDVLHVTGTFLTVGGVSSRGVARIDRVTGLADPWGSQLGNEAYVFLENSLARFGSVLYVCGQPSGGLVALNATSGERLPWSWAPDNYIADMALSDGILVVSGGFRRIAGETRYRLAALDAATGSALPWRCDTDAPVLWVEATGDRIWLFGDQVRRTGATLLRNVAAISGLTGEWLSWNPEVNGPVLALEAEDGVVHAGGAFATIGHTARANLVALDAATGAVTDFVADVSDTVRCLARRGGTLYIGGGFAGVNSVPRANVAAVDATSGAVAAWNPPVNGSVRSLEPVGPAILLGGRFNHAGGAPRNYLARLDAVTGAADAWNPSPSFWVDVVRARGSTIYCGGLFASIGGATRYFAGAVDATTGLATPWDPHLGQGTLTSLDVSTPALHAGGNFATVGGEPRQGIAAFDAAGTLVDPWSVTGTGTVHAIAVHDGTVYVGGDGTFSDGTTSRPYFAAITGAAVDAPAPAAGAPAWRVEPVQPNPLAGSGVVEFELPGPSRVDVAVFDVAGRRVLDLARGAELPAGIHQLPVDRGQLGSGVYFLRVEAAGRVSSTKLVVAPRR